MNTLNSKTLLSQKISAGFQFSTQNRDPANQGGNWLAAPHKRAVTGLVAMLIGVSSFAQQLLQAPFNRANSNSKVTVYDGAVEKYNGTYYLFGTGSAGKVYSSPDMINWSNALAWISTTPATFPAWVSDPNFNANGYEADVYSRFGAGDMFFHNGVMFWCFNSMAFAGFNPSTLNSAALVGASYSVNNPYSRGIDGQLFVTPAGETLYIRKVNPNEPQRGTGIAAVWAFNLNGSFFNEPFSTETNDPNYGQQILIGQTGRWDNLDYFNFEGPELYYHNGQFYMLYVGDKFDPETGLYEVGAAQDTQWTNISNADKYPGKLIARNYEKLMLQYNVIVPSDEMGGVNCQYTFTSPASGWQQPGFDDSTWSSGMGGFGYPLAIDIVRIQGLWNAGQTDPANIWSSSTGPQTIWVRRSFTLDYLPSATALRYRLAGTGTIYVNGHPLVSANGYTQSYSMIQIPSTHLQVGTNVVAATVTANQNLSGNFIDLGVMDTLGKPVEPDIVGPGQPNLVDGPNGFEHWVFYKALWNGNNGQGMSRVYFWKNQEMVVDGPYSEASANFPLMPAQPVYRQNFATAASVNDFDPLPPAVYWNNNALYFNSGSSTNQVLVAGMTNENLFVEAGIKFNTNPGALGQAGVVVWQTDAANWVRVYLQRTTNQACVNYSFNGVVGTLNYPLPSSFAFLPTDPRATSYGEQYHMLKVYKNGASLFAQVDHYWVNDDQPLLVRNEMLTPGRVGLAACQSENYADSLTISPGWEEYGTNINGWSGNWPVTTSGIVSPPSGQQIAIKGDTMIGSEFSAYLDTGTLPAGGKTGLVVEQVNANNYVALTVNYTDRMLELTAVTDGNSHLLGANRTRRDTIYGYDNFKGVGQSQYDYQLRGQAIVSRVRPLWLYGSYTNVGINYLLPNFSLSTFNLKTWNGAAWINQPFSYQNNGRGIYGNAIFSNQVATTQIQLNVPSGINRPEAFAVREEISSQNFLRVLREGGRIYAWANNELVFDVTDPFAGQPARVGLFSQDCATTFQNLTCFQIPVQASATPDTPNELSVPSPDTTYLFNGTNGMPHAVLINSNNQTYFGVQFDRRTSDDSLNYQVLALNKNLQTTGVLWTDAMPYTNSVPINSDFEQVTCVYPLPIALQDVGFLRVAVTR